MITNGVVEFAPGFPLQEMTRATPSDWLSRWSDRIQSYYLSPAETLNRAGHGFASLLLQCSAIEAIGTIAFPDLPLGARFKKTASELLQFTGQDPELLYMHFRCGLVHNGRTNQVGPFRRPKELSAIDFDLNCEYFIQTSASGKKLIVINPKRLLQSLRRGFAQWLSRANSRAIGEHIRNQFQPDLLLLETFPVYTGAGRRNS